tara:strand:+ start:31 stop:447 length:417 start_codon:yes stop_codon:yes gene_type:complete
LNRYSESPYGKPHGPYWEAVVSRRERTGFLSELTDQQLWDKLMKQSEIVKARYEEYRDKPPEEFVEHVYRILYRRHTESIKKQQRETQFVPGKVDTTFVEKKQKGSNKPTESTQQIPSGRIGKLCVNVRKLLRDLWHG